MGKLENEGPISYQVTLRLNWDIYQRAKNAVFWCGEGRTLSKMAEEGMVRILAELEREHNGGKPFPLARPDLPLNKRLKG